LTAKNCQHGLAEKNCSKRAVESALFETITHLIVMPVKESKGLYSSIGYSNTMFSN